MASAQRFGQPNRVSNETHGSRRERAFSPTDRPITAEDTLMTRA